MSRHSLEYKLPVFFAGILALVILALALLAGREVRLLAEQRAEARLLSVSEQFATTSAEGTVRRSAALSVAAHRPQVLAALRNPGPMTFEAARLALEATAIGDSTVLGTRLRDAADNLLFAVGDTAAVRRLPVSPMSRDSLMNVSEFVSMGDTIAYSHSVRVMDGGRMLGRLVQWRRVVLTPAVRDNFRNFIGSQAELYFGNRSGSLWYNLSGQVTSGPPDTVQHGVVVRWTRPDRGERLSIVRSLNTTPWVMAAEIPVSFVMAQPRAFMRRFAVIAVLLLILGVLLAILLSRQLTAPLRNLTEATEAVAAGDYSRNIDDQAQDEIGRLARAFRIMTMRVQDTHRQLEADVADRRMEVRATQEKLQAAVNSLPSGGHRGEDRQQG